MQEILENFAGTSNGNWCTWAFKPGNKPKTVIKEKSDLLEDIIPLEARTDGICCNRRACSMGWM
jgi:hypothetical protein